MLIILDKVNYVYSIGSGFEMKALDDVSLTIDKGEFIGLIGHTGSGKSTLTQHLNGLLRATSGNIYYDGQDIYDKDFVMKNLRSKVGLVFQYPEHQLFENDVFTDVCFGPKNLGLSKKEAERRAFEALEMEPEVLILDEPTAGLDPKGRDEILDQIKKLHEETGMTVILVSHSMEDVAKYVGRLIVLNHGRIMYDDTPEKVFRHYRELEEMGLAAPQLTYILNDLKKNGFDVDTDAITMQDAVETVKKALRR